MTQGALVLLAGLFLMVSGLEAASGRTTASFLKLGVGARGVAMGNSQTAAVDDATALYWNPAALDKLTQKEISFMHNQYFLGVTHDFLGYAQPLGGKGTLGLGLTHVNVDGVTGYGKTGQKTSDLKVTDTMITLGWGREWKGLQLPAFQTGLNVKMLKKTLGEHTGTAAILDLGLQYESKGRWLKGLKTGLVMQNLSGGVKFVEEKAALPQTMKLGLSYPVFGESMQLAGDYVMTRGEEASLNVGMDYRIWEILSFRLGYQGGTSVGGGLAYGVGMNRGAVRMDYALVPYGDLGATHRVSVGYRFGGVTKKDGVEAQVERAYQKALTSYAQGFLVDAYVQATQVMEVAPWHKGSQGLINKVQQDLKELEGNARKDEFEGQIEKHYDRGMAHFDKDEMVQAKREFEVILTLMPEHEGAKSYLAKITERFRNMASNFHEVGLKQFAEGAYQDAKESFQKVLVMDPTHAESPAMIAKTEALLAQAKSQQAAQEKEEKARKLFTDALRDMEAKRYEEAAKQLDQVVELDPSFAEAKRYQKMAKGIMAKQVFDEGMKAMQGGSWAEAMRNFRRALEMKPDYTEAQNLLEKLQARQGEQRKSESIALYKQGLETLLTGDKEKTRELWQKAADIWPENLDAKRGLERLSSGRGQR